MSAGGVVSYSKFGGLDLREPDQVKDDAAIDLLNVNVPGDRVAVREGYTRLGSTVLTNFAATGLFEYVTSAGVHQLLVGTGSRIEAVDTAGAVIASATGLTASSRWKFCGRPGTGVLAANGADTLRLWSGAAWSAPTATVDGVAGRALPSGGSIALQTPSARVAVGPPWASAVGGPNGAATSSSTVYFSAPSDGTTWTTSHRVELPPSQFNNATMASWNNLLFVFQSEQFSVFYGNTVAPDGSPEFNFRTYRGSGGNQAVNAVVAPEGVYFMNQEGVWLTTGEEARCVSRDIDAFFVRGGLPSTFQTQGLNLNMGASLNCMAYWDHRLFITVCVGSSVTPAGEILVYDTRSRAWSMWLAATTPLDVCSFTISTRPELVFIAGKLLYRMNSSLTDDAGTGIVSRYRTRFSDLGKPQQEKTVRESSVTGLGTVSLKSSREYGSLGSASTLALGASMATKRSHVARRGVLLSWELSASSGVWSVSRLEHLVGNVKGAGGVSVQ